jgi:hypothetical protein
VQILWTKAEIGDLTKTTFKNCWQLAVKLGNVTRVGTSLDFNDKIKLCGDYKAATEPTSWDTEVGNINGVVHFTTTISEQESCLVLEVEEREESGNEYADAVRQLLDNHAEELSEWEHDFLTSNAERIEKYGAGTFFSDKQAEVIDRIRTKVGL